MSCSYVSHFDDLLNLELLDNWPIKKQLTDGDVNGGQLILPARGVEDYVIPRLPVHQSEKLRKPRGRIVIGVYDVDRNIRYDMELVKKKKGTGYKLEDWDQVSLPRNIQAGKGIGMSWMDGMLYFKIIPSQ